LLSSNKLLIVKEEERGERKGEKRPYMKSAWKTREPKPIGREREEKREKVRRRAASFSLLLSLHREE